MAHPLCSASRVLAVPELVTEIVSSCTRPDIARLARASRRPFDILIPKIWDTVDGIHNLLRLIEFASLEYHRSSGQLSTVILRRNKSELDDLFARFDLYASFVTTLRVYGRNQGYFAMSNWAILYSRACRQPLLPNLRTLNFASRSHTACGKDETKWINLLGTNLIHVVHFSRLDEGSRCLFTESAASTIMGTLVRRCPNVRDLRIYPSEDINEVEDSASDISDPISNSSELENGDAFDNNLASSNFFATGGAWHLQLHEMLQLQTISLNDDGMLAASCLVVLACLPNLHTLEFYSYDHPSPEHFDDFEIDDFEDTSASLPQPDIAFSKLNRLILRQLNPCSVFRILCERTMLRKLTEVHIDCAIEVDFEDRDDWVTHRFFPLLAHSPFLRHLKIEDSYNDSWTTLEPVVCTMATPEILGILANMPLESLYLDYMHLGTGKLNKDLALVWPSLTELSLPSQRASLWELSYFATIPNLRSLMVQLYLTKARVPPNAPSHKAPLTILKAAVGSTIVKSVGMMKHNARVLRELWPDLLELTWEQDSAPFASQSARRLNIALLLDKASERYETLEQGSRKAVDLRSAMNFITAQLCWKPSDPYASSDSEDLDE